MATVPFADLVPSSLPPGAAYFKGQAEQGSETNFRHWQVLIYFPRKVRLSTVKQCLSSTAHAELTRSNAIEDYVWKEDTRIPGTQFEFGTKPSPRATTKDWEKIWNSAVEGDLDSIPYDIRVRYYSAVRRISSDFARPVAITRRAYLFYGATGTGKSYRAWSEAGEEAYPKDPRTKFWCGYQGQAHVVLDEFRGGIDVAHMLRWLDNYPVSVELKGSSTPLKATNFWITSNLHPCEWYPGLDSATVAALLRRLEIIEMNEPYVL